MTILREMFDKWTSEINLKQRGIQLIRSDKHDILHNNYDSWKTTPNEVYVDVDVYKSVNLDELFEYMEEHLNEEFEDNFLEQCVNDTVFAFSELTFYFNLMLRKWTEEKQEELEQELEDSYA